MFIATMRTGRHEGKGRPLLPPMPVQILAALDDEDIKALFAYLQSLPPVKNRVPAPIDPPEEQAVMTRRVRAAAARARCMRWSSR